MCSPRRSSFLEQHPEEVKKMGEDGRRVVLEIVQIVLRNWLLPKDSSREDPSQARNRNEIFPKDRVLCPGAVPTFDRSSLSIWAS